MKVALARILFVKKKSVELVLIADSQFCICVPFNEWSNVWMNQSSPTFHPESRYNRLLFNNHVGILVLRKNKTAFVVYSLSPERYTVFS
jgi:hypothetical protein